MGDYTTIDVTIRLKNVPPEVIRLLEAANDLAATSFRPLPNHPFFSTERWDWILSSAGTNGLPGNGILYFEDGVPTLHRRCQLKNYDGEIEQFLDWLSPYVAEDEGFVAGEYETEYSYEDYKIVLIQGLLQVVMVPRSSLWE